VRRRRSLHQTACGKDATGAMPHLTSDYSPEKAWLHPWLAQPSGSATTRSKISTVFRWFSVQTAPASRNRTQTQPAPRGRSNKQHPDRSEPRVHGPPTQQPAREPNTLRRRQAEAPARQFTHLGAPRDRTHVRVVTPRSGEPGCCTTDPNRTARCASVGWRRTERILFCLVEKIGEFRLTATSWVNSIEIAAGKSTRAYCPLAHQSREIDQSVFDGSAVHEARVALLLLSASRAGRQACMWGKGGHYRTKTSTE
jgi:hypothetical protein